MIPVTQTAVENILGRELTDAEIERPETLVSKAQRASMLVEGYIGIQYGVDDVIPDAVTVVTASVVARSYSAAANQVPEFVNTSAEGMGPFSVSRTYNQDATGGSMWLTKADKTMLMFVNSGVRSVSMLSDRGCDAPA